MKTITEILRENGQTGWQGTDKQREHQYGPVYDALFPTKASREGPSNILEIGIAYGGSLLCWREAFPYANIFGIDTDPCAGFHPPDRVYKYQGSQTDYGFLTSVIGGRPFNLIIDDASHRIADQLTTLFYLWPQLVPGGKYVIEEFGIQDGHGSISRWMQNLELFCNAKLIGTDGPGGPEFLIVLEKP